MTSRPDWARIVRDHAARTGAVDLPPSAIAELAAAAGRDFAGAVAVGEDLAEV